jgi:hypothetical protein
MRFSGGLRVRDAFRASTGLLRGFWAGLVLSRRDAHQYAEERTDRGHAGFARNAAVGAGAEPAGCSFRAGAAPSAHVRASWRVSEDIRTPRWNARRQRSRSRRLAQGYPPAVEAQCGDRFRRIFGCRLVITRSDLTTSGMSEWHGALASAREVRRPVQVEERARLLQFFCAS